MTAAKFRVRSAPLVATDELVRRLAGGDPWFASRLGGQFNSGPDLERVVDRVSAAHFDREALVLNLSRFNRECDNSERALERIRELRDPSTLLVVTGQQPGFFGGPLLCVLKAATAIATARELSTRSNRKVHALFWIASDDHDLDEVTGATILDAEFEYRKIRAEVAHHGQPIADLVVDEAVLKSYLEAVRAASLEDVLSTAEPTSSAAQFLTPRQGESWSLWFARVLARLFADSGLILFEPASAPNLTRPFLEIARKDATAAPKRLAEGAEQLKAHGIAPPLPTDIPSSIFVTIDGRRQRFDPAVPRSDESVSSGPLTRSQISADAGLRTVLQSQVFPAIAVVGGPGELKYWLQLTELFSHYETTMPLFVPRIGATLITPPVRRAITQLKLSDDEAFLGEETLAKLVQARHRPDSSSEWVALGVDALASFERFASKIRELGGSLPARIDQSTAALKSSIDRIVELASKRQQEVDGVSEKKIRMIARSLRPMNKPQDRVLGPLPFALRFGDDLFDCIAKTLDPFDSTARIIDLGISESPAP